MAEVGSGGLCHLLRRRKREEIRAGHRHLIAYRRVTDVGDDATRHTFKVGRSVCEPLSQRSGPRGA